MTPKNNDYKKKGKTEKEKKKKKKKKKEIHKNGKSRRKQRLSITPELSHL
jgi:hypothetical protein